MAKHRKKSSRRAPGGESTRSGRGERAARPGKSHRAAEPRTGLWRGVAVSPGVAVGRAFCIHDIFAERDLRPLNDADVLGELARYDQARERTATDLATLRQKVHGQVGPQQAAIFQMHETILRDAAFTAKVRDWIVREKLSAHAALHRLLDEYTQLFAATADEYLRDRLADIRDVIVRVAGHLSEAQAETLVDPEGPLVLVASELVPSHAVALGQRPVAGIVTERGGKTSHAAILARGRGIPAVSGVERILSEVRHGDEVVVDGREGHVLVNPDYETLAAYRKLQREFFHLKDTLAANRDLPAVSEDGQQVELLANISHLDDARAATAMGAVGVGLFRTEYLFLTHADVPDEDEQVEAYRAVIAESPRHRVTIRTLDVGGDKTVEYLGVRQEANPFLGWRSIRISFEHPQFFLTQIRAVLRAAVPWRGVAAPKVRLMCPMVTTVEEMRKIRALMTRACRQLAAEGKPFAEVPLGLMLEVPAAAMTLDFLLEVADFVSVGSNDLVQYLMAADRDNPKVSHLCDPLSPAVLHVLADVIRTCRVAGKPITVCGEAAGAPRACLLLFGMGLRSFSMSPAFVPTIKDLMGHLTVAEAERITRHALGLRTQAEISRYLARQVARLAPNLALLEAS